MNPGVTEDELRRPAGFATRSQLGVKFVETPRTLEAVPQQIPLWFVAASLAVPVVACWIWLILFAPRRGNVPELWWFGVLAAMVAPALLFIFHAMNRTERDKGKLFVLDMTTGELDLPRLKTKLTAAQVREVIELRGWANVRSEIGKFAEISVLAQVDGGPLRRYPLVFDSNYPRGLRAPAKRLAEHFRVPHRVIETPYSEMQRYE